ncbi:urease accessory protein UreF [Aminobacter sp. BE322]|uniref:urease accessory protein UreF n=1 Tax=unclassified Aminobacter TaxID=2644704 RepID=UPI003D248A52
MITTITITTMVATTITTMTERGNTALLRLMAWLSPTFPVGGFSYSHGLERAVHDDLIANRDDLAAWLTALAEIGSGWNDTVLFAESWRRAGTDGDLREVAELAEALAGSRERHMESMLQGQAFLAAAAAWPHPVIEGLPAECPYCVSVGAVAGAHGIVLEDALAAWLQAFATNLVQAAIRLGVVGQTAATGIVAGFEPVALSVAALAAVSTLDDLGSAAITSDIMAMRHETQHSRLFRS